MFFDTDIKMSQQMNREYATDINNKVLEVINKGETLAAGLRSVLINCK